MSLTSTQRIYQHLQLWLRALIVRMHRSHRCVHCQQQTDVVFTCPLCHQSQGVCQPCLFSEWAHCRECDRSANSSDFEGKGEASHHENALKLIRFLDLGEHEKTVLPSWREHIRAVENPGAESYKIVKMFQTLVQQGYCLLRNSWTETETWNYGTETETWNYGHS